MASADQSRPQPSHWVELTREAIDPAAAIAHVADPSCGAVVVFLGTVRDHSDGVEGVTHLEYEAYEEVVEAKIAEIVAETMGRWPVKRLVAIHRVGDLAVGEVSVAVVAASPHRSDAFPAAKYLIDELKARAPIWKKEHWPGGAEWVREDHHHTTGQ